MTDKELLAAAVIKRSPYVARYRAAETIRYIGRWGTCVDCPRSNGSIKTWDCPNTDRYDHWIDFVKDDGNFHFDGKEVTRADLESFLLKEPS